MAKRVELRHCAKFCWNRWSRSRDIAIFWIFKMAVAAVLYFWNYKFLTVGTDCSNRGWDMVICQDGGRRHIEFSKFQILTVVTVKKDQLRHRAKFLWNCLYCGWDMAICYFFKMAAIRHLGFVCWDHPRRAFDAFCHYAEFGWNWCSSFDNMHVLISRVWLHAPKLFWGFDPLSGEQCEQIPKRHILARVRFVCAIMRGNLTGLTCRWVPKKGHQ